jgi:ubiquinone/menaquinone biosynthesis C-methylase UbiE
MDEGRPLSQGLPRVLEPEVMDTVEDAIEYDSMDHSEVNRRFVDDLVAAGYAGGSTLDLAAGTALIPIELAKRFPDAKIWAIDLAVQMLYLARNNLEIAGIPHRVRLDRQDAKALTFPDDFFESVISNSLLHHLAEPAVAFRESLRVAQPGALLFHRDLLRPESEAEVSRLVDLYAGDATPYQRQLFDQSLRAALTMDEVRRMVAAEGFSHDSVQTTSDRHWTFAGRKRSS